MYEGHTNIIGLMSGTSMDGMDAAVCQFDNSSSRWELLYFITFPYPQELAKKVNETFEKDSEAERADLDQRYATWAIYCIEHLKIWAQSHQINLHAVGMHGQTVFHRPDQKFTYQAGCLERVAKETGLALVTNFRVQDVLLGGQGAPLVPMGDQVLFGDYAAALNIGGFANISCGHPTLADGVSLAYDIAPANIVLNEWAQMLGQPYDDQGNIARSHSINSWVLDQLESLDYYELPAPKSLGKEWVETHLEPILYALSPAQALSTFTEHLAMRIVDALPREGTTLVTGGGAHNTYLLQRISLLGGTVERAPEPIGDAKEAIIFAFLAHRRLRGEYNVLGHLTGSGTAHSSGCVYLP